MLDVISLGDYYSAITDGKLPDLRSEVNGLCRERFRRIDRFIQLCLLGSARCVGNQVLPAGTGLYIGSRFAAIANTVNVQNQMFVDGQLPKPAHFIHTLSNSAGYYVARNLQLQNKNIFVSRGDASMEAALQLAALDLQSGQVQQALVGVVDEGVLPLAEHCGRMVVPADTPLGEGSHWFLIRRQAEPRGLASIADVRTLYGRDSLDAWLNEKSKLTKNTVIYSDIKLSAALSTLGLDLYQPEPKLNYYPSRTAAVVLHFMEERKNQSLLTITGDEDGRYHVTHAVGHA